MHALTVGRVIDRVEERAFGVVMAFLCLPFLLPVTIPGSSIPFGAVLMFLGFQLVTGRREPWLPERVRAWQLPRTATKKIISGVARLFRPLERVIRPRAFFMQSRIMLGLVGAAITVDAFFLSLPWPPVIPLSNTVPAWLILIKVLGLTEEDGAAMLIGLLLTTGFLIAGVTAVVIGWVMISENAS